MINKLQKDYDYLLRIIKENGFEIDSNGKLYKKDEKLNVLIYEYYYDNQFEHEFEHVIKPMIIEEHIYKKLSNLFNNIISNESDFKSMEYIVTELRKLNIWIDCNDLSVKEENDELIMSTDWDFGNGENTIWENVTLKMETREEFENEERIDTMF